MKFPHPRKIYTSAKTLTGIALLAFGLVGVFYPAAIPMNVMSIVPQEAFSIARENLVLISAFASMIAGFVLLARRK